MGSSSQPNKHSPNGFEALMEGQECGGVPDLKEHDVPESGSHCRKGPSPEPWLAIPHLEYGA